MAMPIRVKTVWFKKDGERSAENASAMAAATWREADKAIDNLGRENYDIITPERGFKLDCRISRFLAHYCNRMAYGSLSPERRLAVLQALSNKLGEVMEQNVREVVGKDDPRNYKRNSSISSSIVLPTTANSNSPTTNAPASRPSFFSACRNPRRTGRQRQPG